MKRITQVLKREREDVVFNVAPRKCRELTSQRNRHISYLMKHNFIIQLGLKLSQRRLT